MALHWKETRGRGTRGVHLLTSWPLHPRASKRGAPNRTVNEKGHDVRFLLFLLCSRFVQRPKQLGHLDLLVQVINFAFDGLFQPITRLGGVPREAMLSFDERSAKYIRGEGRAEYCRLSLCSRRRAPGPRSRRTMGLGSRRR